MSIELLELDADCADSTEEIEVCDFVTEQDSDPALEIWSSPFLSDLDALATKWIRAFFKDKQMYCGGPISRNIIVRQQYIDQVMTYDIDHAVKAIYAAWHTAALGVVTLKEVRQINLVGRIPSDVEAVLAVLRECAAVGVPKPLAGGIAMMYFEFCEGFDFDEEESPVSINVA